MIPIVEKAVTLHTVSMYLILKLMTVFSKCLIIGRGKAIRKG